MHLSSPHMCYMPSPSWFDHPQKMYAIFKNHTIYVSLRATAEMWQSCIVMEFIFQILQLAPLNHHSTDATCLVSSYSAELLRGRVPTNPPLPHQKKKLNQSLWAIPFPNLFLFLRVKGTLRFVEAMNCARLGTKMGVRAFQRRRHVPSSTASLLSVHDSICRLRQQNIHVTQSGSMQMQ